MAVMVSNFMIWIQKYWLGLIVSALLSILVDWKIGYYGNGLFDYKFDLASCWQGLAVVGSAGFIGAVRYLLDSWLNTNRSEMPKYESEGGK